MFRYTRSMFVVFPRVALLVLTLALAGCAGPQPLGFGEDPAGIGRHQQIFVATTRGSDGNQHSFSGERSDQLSYARYTVSVPPGHRPGQIEWPTGNPDPGRHFVTVGSKEFGGSDGFRAAISKAIANQGSDGREAIVFVHGYNTSFAKGLYRLTQMFHDMRPPGIAVHYSWPSSGRTSGYVYDRDSTVFARDGLEQLLITLAGTGVSRIVLVGHSMGGFLTIETLRQMAIRDNSTINRMLGGVVLISPDIDIDVFKAQASRINPLPKPFVIFVSNRDRALSISAKLTGRTERLGSLSDISTLNDLNIIVVNTSNFDDGDATNHLTPATSPALISILNGLPRSDLAGSLADLQENRGLLSGTVTISNHITEIVLTPDGR